MWNARRFVRPLIVLALVGLRTGPPPQDAGVRSDPPFPREFTQIHMGLAVRIRLYSPSEAGAGRAAAAAFARVAELDRMMSDYRPDNELRSLGEPTVSPDVYAVLARALEIAEATDGAFDPTVGPLVALWRDARKTGRMPDPSVRETALGLVGWRHVHLDRARRTVRLARPGMRLDLGGVAKGYILQQALAAMAPHGVTRALLEAATLAHAALATSGPAAQSVEIAGVRYSHVIDPRTGIGLTRPVTAYVIADDAATADALATALTVADPGRRSGILSRFAQVMAFIAD